MSDAVKEPEKLTPAEKAEMVKARAAQMGQVVSSPRVNGADGAMSYFAGAGGMPIGGNLLKGASSWRSERLIRQEQMKADGYDPQFKSFNHFLKSIAGKPLGDKPENFKEMHQKSIGSLKKAYGLNTFDGDGAGSLILPEFAADVFEREWANDLFARTDNYTVSGNRMSFPKLDENSRVDGERHGGIQAYWTGEGKTVTDSKPAFGEVSLKLNDLCVAVFITQDMLDDDSYALQQRVTRVVRREINFMLGLAVTEGRGINQPLGYRDAPGTVVVSKESGQAAGTINGDNIVNMWSRRLANSSVDSLIWTTNQDVEPQLANLTLGSADAAQLTYLPPGGLSQSPYASLMGRPVMPTEFNETVGTKGDLALCDFSNMVSISKGGIMESVSMHVEFLRRAMCYLFCIRVDARPFDEAPITPLKGTNTQSAFVVLETRA